MYNCGVGVVEQYGLTAENMYRGRGAILCETKEGLKILKEFGGAHNKLAMQRELQEHICEAGFPRTDRILLNQEGELVTADSEGTPYYVRNWFHGRECDTKSAGDIRKGALELAKLHKVMHLPTVPEYTRESLVMEYTRHNAELRKVRKFILKKRRKNPFEDRILACMSEFLQEGEAAVEALKNSDYEQLRAQALEAGCVCHGEYNQHNILISDGTAAVTNFGRWNFDVQVTDLYQYLRKIMEKNNWDIRLASQILDTYERERSLSAAEWRNLQIRLMYPWKFWKLVNCYAGNNKAWISGKNLEKLEQIAGQQESWKKFIKKLFSDSFF